MSNSVLRPGRTLVRVAGTLTQLGCGACVLIGTIGMVLVRQSGTGSLALAIGWIALSMAGLVAGGLSHRGGGLRLALASAISAAAGILLLGYERDGLGRLLATRPADDVEMIRSALDGLGCGLLVAAVSCFVALPQGVRYARWFRAAAEQHSAGATARRIPREPMPILGASYIIPDEERPVTRRWLYGVLCVLAVAVGVGAGVLVSARGRGSRGAAAARASASPGSAASEAPHAPPDRGAVAAVDGSVDDGAGGSGADDVAAKTAGDATAGAGSGDGTAIAAPPPPSPSDDAVSSARTVQQLVLALHRATGTVDRAALTELIAPRAFSFGVENIADGRDAVVAQIARDLGAPPRGGFSIESRALSIGELRGHAWIAEQIDVAAPERARRHFAISALAAAINGGWRIVALHWAVPLPDTTAQQLASLGVLPVPAPIPDQTDGADEVARAVRAAFASRSGLAAAYSDRADVFNFGSGGERVRGGAAIRRIFSRLEAEIRIRGGVRAAAGGAWDPKQAQAPWIGWAALDVDYVSHTAGAETTQTFRVLAIAVKDSAGWKLAQTHWSNAGVPR